MDKYEKNLTLNKLKSEYRAGRIAGIAPVGDTIRFVYRGAGEYHGYLVKSDGGIRRFDGDAKAWQFIETKIRGGVSL